MAKVKGSKLLNQMVIEQGIHKADTLISNVLDHREIMETNVQNALADKDTLQATYDYIFGVSDVNPLEGLREEYKLAYDNYIATMDHHIELALNSKKPNVSKK